MHFKWNFMKVLLSFRNIPPLTLRSLRTMGVGTCVLLTIPVGTFALGTWQVQRRSWKLKLIEELESKSKAPPIDLPDSIDDLTKLDYCPVRVRGSFDHSREVYIGPRSLIDNRDDSSSSLFSSTPLSGYLVITPFKLFDKDKTILVNRGWVPRSILSKKNRQEGQVTGVIDLVGTLRISEKRPVFAAVNQPGSHLFHFRDLYAMAAKCDASPIFIDANYESSVPGGPVGGQTRVTLRNEHLSYILTWYCLSAATFWMWYKRYVQRRPYIYR